MGYEKIPKYLKDTASWCCWRLQTRPGDDKPTKVPYNPLTGKGAKSNDRSTFARFAQAEMALELNGYDGLGIGIFDDLCVIDIDHCVQDGVFSDVAVEIVEAMNTYAEISPSGDGIHLYFRAPDLAYDKEKYYIKNPKNGVEIYLAGATNRFITVTGNALTDAGINDRTSQLQKILEQYMCRNVPQNRTQRKATPILRLSLDDAAIVKMAENAKNGDLFKRLWGGDTTGYKSASEADIALCNLLAFWTSKNAEQMDRMFRASGLYRDGKWDRKTGATTYGAMTIQNAIDTVGSTYSDFFMVRLNISPDRGGANGSK